MTAEPPAQPGADGARVANEAHGADSQPLSVPPAPPVAAEIFGARLGAAAQYARLLAGPGVTRGLIGPHEIPRLWDRHLLNSAVVAELVPRPCSLMDLGSGAGLPGIVLALLLPDVAVTLLEPMQRRAVAPLARLVPLALGLVRPGGIVLAIKGAGAEREVAAARRSLRRAGVTEVAIVHPGHGKVDPAATVVRLTAGRPTGGGARPRGEEP